MSLGQMIDNRARLKEERQQAQRVVDDLDERIKQQDAEIMALMREQGVTLAAGNDCKATLNEETMPRVTDWNTLYNYIKENNAFYLLHKRISATAFRDTRQAVGDIPGTEVVNITSISFKTT